MSTKKPLFLTDYQLLIVLCRFCFVDLADRAVVASDSDILLIVLLWLLLHISC